MIDYINSENAVIDLLKLNFKLKIEEACFSTDLIPKHILLDKTRNIHSYIVIATYNDDEYYGRFFSDKDNFENQITELIKTQYSKLDRPLFFIIKDQNESLLCIEGNFIREFILQGNYNQTIKQFIINESIGFSEIITQIKNEL